MMNVDDYTRHFLNRAQVGGRLNVYRGASYQRGHGIASFFRGLFKSAMPLLRSGVRGVVNETARTGVNFLGDITENKPVRESFHRRIGEAGSNLKRKFDEKLHHMTGDGLKRVKRLRILQCRGERKRNKISPKTKKTLVFKPKKKKPVSKKKKTPKKKKNKKSTDCFRDIFA